MYVVDILTVEMMRLLDLWMLVLSRELEVVGGEVVRVVVSECVSVFGRSSKH